QPDRASHRRGREDGDGHRVRGRAERAEARTQGDPRRGRAGAGRPVQEALSMTVRDVGVVIVAAGASTRTTGTDQGRLKQLRWVAGKPMLLHSLQTFQQRADVAMVVCVLPQSYAGDPPPWLFQCDI